MRCERRIAHSVSVFDMYSHACLPKSVANKERTLQHIFDVGADPRFIDRQTFVRIEISSAELALEMKQVVRSESKMGRWGDVIR